MIFWLGTKLGDHLDSKYRLGYWSVTFVCMGAGVSLTLLFEPAVVATAPFVLWAILSAVLLGVSAMRMAKASERIMAICGMVMLLLCALSVMLPALKFDGYLPSSWSVALLPVYLFCSAPVVIAPLTCLAICWKAPISCSHMFDCSRRDPAESVLVGTAAALFGLFVGFPLLFMVILMLPIADGSSRLVSVALVPVYLDFFVLMLVAMRYVVKEIEKQRGR